MDTGNAVQEWLTHRRLTEKLKVHQIDFAKCSRWFIRNGQLQHDTGGFFSVVGYRSLESIPYLSRFEQPMIDQPEVGILGFLVKQSKQGYKWLLQAKAEPGNVGFLQIAPTVQATYSNYMRVHGGQETNFLEAFLNPASYIQRMTDIEQSEQGDRFLEKYNRNMVMKVPEEYEPLLSPQWKWFSVRALKDALQLNYIFNTDSRSVLFSSDWNNLTDRVGAEPFSQWHKKGNFGESLWNSWKSKSGYLEAHEAMEILKKAQSSQIHKWTKVGLDEMSGWEINKHGIQSIEYPHNLILGLYSVDAINREVKKWDQPLMRNDTDGNVVLLCSKIDGCLKFLLHLSFEPGFKAGAQWAPSFVSGTGHGFIPGVLKEIRGSGVNVHAKIMQSDEGGRFMHSNVCYELVEVSSEFALHSPKSQSEGIWISLAGLKELASYRGMTTNELRSVGSLLLRWC